MCIRHPSQGRLESRLEPSARINLHFTGDLHAVTSAHNLLAALADNHVYFRTPAGGNGHELDPRQMTLPNLVQTRVGCPRDIDLSPDGTIAGVE